jgi:hypothetical protein
MKKDKRTNNDLQSTTQKTKDRVIRTPQKLGCEQRCSGWVSSFCSSSGIRHFTWSGLYGGLIYHMSNQKRKSEDRQHNVQTKVAYIAPIIFR